MTGSRQWTVMVYMAGDAGKVFEGPITGEQLFDDLSKAIPADLEKMRAAGSTDQVAVCVQFDSLKAEQAFRWVVPRQDEPVPAEPKPIGATNTGEPGSLSDFVAWAGQECPARSYALVIWGHGSGWDEDDLYERYPDSETAQTDRADARDVLLRRGIFGSTVAQIMGIPDDQDRGLCYDDSARDFLDNAELRRALRDAARHLGRERIDVLGLDACLMNMIEVAHQIRGEASYLVGAETVLPTDYWPWTDILLALQAAPDMAPAQLAVTLAGYLPAGPGGVRSVDDVAQSVLELSRAGEAAAALDAWSSAVLARYDSDLSVELALQRALGTSVGKVLRLRLPGAGLTDYVDLLDFLRRFVVEYTYHDADDLLALLEEGQAGPAHADAELVQATARLLRAVRPSGTGSLVLHNRIEGFEHEPQPGGLSIYLPALDDQYRRIKDISPQYGNLDLSDTAWPELICRLYKKDGLPDAFVRFREERRALAAKGLP